MSVKAMKHGMEPGGLRDIRTLDAWEFWFACGPDTPATAAE